MALSQATALLAIALLTSRNEKRRLFSCIDSFCGLIICLVKKCYLNVWTIQAFSLPQPAHASGCLNMVMVTTYKVTCHIIHDHCHWQKMFLPHPRVKVSIVGSLRDREVACSASDRQGSNFESCVWRTVSSQSSHHPQEVLLAQFSLYVHKGGLKPDSFHFLALPLTDEVHCLQKFSSAIAVHDIFNLYQLLLFTVFISS